MSSKVFRTSLAVKADIALQEDTVIVAKGELEKLLKPGKEVQRLKDRIRGYEGNILHLVVDDSHTALVMGLGKKLGEARAELRAAERWLPAKDRIEESTERVANSVRHLNKLRVELGEAEAREAVAEVKSRPAAAK
jgi:hypothetical protein